MRVEIENEPLSGTRKRIQRNSIKKYNPLISFEGLQFMSSSFMRVVRFRFLHSFILSFAVRSDLTLNQLIQKRRLLKRRRFHFLLSKKKIKLPNKTFVL